MAGPDLSSITTLVDLSSVIVALANVFGVIVTLQLLRVGIRMVHAAVCGDDISNDRPNRRWEALMSQDDGIWFSDNKTGAVKFRPYR